MPYCVALKLSRSILCRPGDIYYSMAQLCYVPIIHHYCARRKQVKLLPYPEKPIFQCYHDKAFQVGIIQGNAPEETKKWACTKYLNCVFAPKVPNKFIIIEDDDWGVKEHLVTQQFFQMQREFLIHFKMDLLYILKTAIYKNYYIYGIYNEKYIPTKRSYRQRDFMHDFLLIGCDDDKFISVGYVSNGTFRKFEISNADMLDSLHGLSGTEMNLRMISYNIDAQPTPNYKRMIEKLTQYISTSDYLAHSTPDEESHGIASNIRLREFFTNEVDLGKIYVDHRYSRALYEHKWVLAQLVDQFLEDGNEKRRHQEWASKDLQRAHLVHMLGMKMSYTGDARIITRVADLMNQIIEDETQNIPVLLNLLQTKYSKYLP